jgi:hypothetical protein
MAATTHQQVPATRGATDLEENIEQGMEELSRQYTDVVAEGRRLGVAMSALESFAPTFGPDDTLTPKFALPQLELPNQLQQQTSVRRA